MKQSKSFLKIVVLTALMVLWIPVISSAANYYVTTTTVNMRSKAGTNYSVVLELPRECVVDVKSTSNSKWYKVEYKNNEQEVFKGYIYYKYLEKASLYQTTCQLNLRTSPSGSKVVSMPKGATVIVVNTNTGAWYKSVYFTGSGKVYRGYAYQDHLMKKGATKGKYVTLENVYMHTEPRITSRNMMIVPKGKTVDVVNISHGKWYQCKYKVNGTTYTGYISNLILKKKA